MSEATLDQEIMSEVQKLDTEMQLHILEIVRGLARQKGLPQGEPGWLFVERTRHIHIEPDDLQLMENAIMEDRARVYGFPKVNLDE